MCSSSPGPVGALNVMRSMFRELRGRIFTYPREKLINARCASKYRKKRSIEEKRNQLQTYEANCKRHMASRRRVMKNNLKRKPSNATPTISISDGARVARHLRVRGREPPHCLRRGGERPLPVPRNTGKEGLGEGGADDDVELPRVDKHLILHNKCK